MRVKAVAGFVGVMGVVFVAAAMLAQGCGGSSPASCAVGKESCPCTPGGACDPGLTCASMKCVNLGTVDGGGTAGATGTAGGTAGGGGAGTAGASGGTAEAACANYGAVCQKINDCAPLVVKVGYGTVDKCIARSKLSCMDAFKAPDSGATAATIATCVAAIPAATCEDVIYRTLTACAIKGGRTNGSACGTAEQCMSGHCTNSDVMCGVCADYVGAGSACAVDEDCTPGLVCGGDLHCVTPAVAGSICNDNQPCKVGLYCRNGSCVNGAETPGATCEPTLAVSCDILKGIYCDATLGKCANLGFAPNGDPCGSVSGKLVVCAEGECIKTALTDAQGLCGSLAGDGAACDATTACEAPARCVAGHCKLPSSAACL